MVLHVEEILEVLWLFLIPKPRATLKLESYPEDPVRVLLILPFLPALKTQKSLNSS